MENIHNDSPGHACNPDPNTPTVLLFGEILIDVFPDHQVLGGAPFNVARHLRAFGLNPVLITRTGDDQVRTQLMQAMEGFAMDTRAVQKDALHPTGQVMVHLESGGHRFEIVPEQAYDFIDAGEAHDILTSLHPQLLYFGTLAQRHGASRKALLEILAGVDSPHFLDLNLRQPWYDQETIQQSLLHADIVKLNNDELATIAQMFGLSGADDLSQALQLIERFSLQQVLVTSGAQGAWLLDRDGTKSHVIGPSTPVSVVDTVGAGDGFASVFILGTLLQWAATPFVAQGKGRGGTRRRSCGCC